MLVHLPSYRKLVILTLDCLQGIFLAWTDSVLNIHKGSSILDSEYANYIHVQTSTHRYQFLLKDKISVSHIHPVCCHNVYDGLREIWFYHMYEVHGMMKHCPLWWQVIGYIITTLCFYLVFTEVNYANVLLLLLLQEIQFIINVGDPARPIQNIHQILITEHHLTVT